MQILGQTPVTTPIPQVYQSLKNQWNAPYSTAKAMEDSPSA